MNKVISVFMVFFLLPVYGKYTESKIDLEIEKVTYRKVVTIQNQKQDRDMLIGITNLIVMNDSLEITGGELNRSKYRLVTDELSSMVVYIIYHDVYPTRWSDEDYISFCVIIDGEIIFFDETMKKGEIFSSVFITRQVLIEPYSVRNIRNHVFDILYHDDNR